MAWLILARCIVLIGVTYAAAALQPFGAAGVLVNAAFGGGLALAAIALEWRMRDVSVPHVLGALVGAGLGLLFANLVTAALITTGDVRWTFFRRVVLLVFPYIGLVIGARRGEWLEPARLATLFRSAAPPRRHTILDTSVIIDGRVADICETGFLDGTLVVPHFVLKDLQQVADSGDTMRRNRGRRGLDILQKIQKMTGVEVVVSDMDFPGVREVDLKLIELARALQGTIVTNDFNLNKVAQLRGVKVLNINDLANAMKPVVLPGEVMKVFILKEGKEYNQGVAYLDDGTMVVVDNARKLISKTIDVTVTSVLQTTAGKMIFGRHIDSGAAPQPTAPERDDTRGRQRPGAPPPAAPQSP
jgi:uncharacterized protein YacL